MQDITELERRITAALDRIGSGLDGLDRVDPTPASPDSDPDAPDPAQILADLEAERAVTAQLEERLRTSRERHDARLVEIEREVDRVKALLDAMEQDRQRLKAVNDALRNSNQALREANADGISDAHLVNTAVMTELDALRAMRDSDRAELNGIITALAPVLEQNGEAANA